MSSLRWASGYQFCALQVFGDMVYNAAQQDKITETGNSRCAHPPIAAKERGLASRPNCSLQPKPLHVAQAFLLWGMLLQRKGSSPSPVIDIITILYGRKPYKRKVDLDAALMDKRHVGGEPIPKKFSETVQGVINHYTSQSSVFQKLGRGPEDDLFYSPKGKGSGTWALHTDRAAAWLKKKN